MPLMFPARHAESHAHGVDDVDRVREIVRRTLRDLSWTIEQQMADRIFAKTSASIWSLGENVEIEWRQEMHLSITSRCAVPTQCFDWGKNRENVAAFMSGFQNNVTLAIEAEAFSRDSHVESPEALRQPANTVASEAIGNASVECGQCRFKVLSEGHREWCSTKKKEAAAEFPTDNRLHSQRAPIHCPARLRASDERLEDSDSSRS